MLDSGGLVAIIDAMSFHDRDVNVQLDGCLLKRAGMTLWDEVLWTGVEPSLTWPTTTQSVHRHYVLRGLPERCDPHSTVTLK